MKHKFYTVTILLFSLISNHLYSQEKPSIDEKFMSLKGEWQVIVEAQDRSGEWVKSAPTTATFSGLLDDTFIIEDVTYKSPGMTINMHVIFGVDARTGKYRALALDKEFGTMDVYEGIFKDNKLIVDNLNDEGFTMQDGTKLNYRLSYKFQDDKNHFLEVDFTSNEGKDWKPFQRIMYKRIK